MSFVIPVNRIEPNLPVTAMKTYGLSAPQETHYRRASCAEVDCPNYANGWRSGFDVTDPEKAHAAYLIRMHSGRLFTVQELTGPSGSVEQVIFTFGPGQECFLRHSVPLEREPVLYVRDGDWRGNPTGRAMVHADAADWVDDFGEHQERIAARVEQG
jgi:hypothetical protein